MSSYDSLQMFRNELGGGGGGGDSDNRTNTQSQQPPSSKIPDAKLKQFFEVQSKIEPFFTGGQVVALSPVHFGCQCGPSVKLVSIVHSKTVKDEEVRVESDVDPEQQKDKDKTEVESLQSQDFFEILGTIDVELDEILVFDGSPATQSLVTAHKSGLLRVWDGNTHQILRTVKSLHPVPISGLQIWKPTSSFRNSGTGETELARGGLVWATVAGNGLKVWDSGGATVSKLLSVGDLPSIGFVKWDTSEFSLENPNPRLWIGGRNLYAVDEVTSGDGKGKEWKITKNLQGHFSQVTGVEWWAEGHLMISGARDKTLILWSSKDDAYTKLSTIAFPGPIDGMTALQSGDLYISTGSRVLHFELRGKKLGKEPALCLSSTGDQNSGLEDTDSNSILSISPPLNQGHGSKDELPQFFISTHTSLLCQVQKNHTTTATIPEKSLPPSKKHPKSGGSTYGLTVKKMFVGSLEEILDVVLWEEGAVNGSMAVANNTNTIKLYDLSTGNCELLLGHSDIVLCLRVQGKFLLSGSKDNKIGIWEANSRSPVAMLEGHIGSVSSVVFGPSGPKTTGSSTADLTIFSVSEDTFLKCWTGGRCTKSVVAHDKEIHVVDCSPNGKLIATGSRDKSVKIWSSPKLKLQSTLKGHKKGVWDCKFSEWDQLLVTGSADATIKIWNVQNFSCLQTLQGHDSTVLRVKFINQGLQVISSSTDGTWRTWDLRNSVCLAVLEASDSSKIWALDGKSDGSLIVTGSADSRLILWKDVTESKVQEAITKRNQLIEDEQELTNVLRRQDWSEGVRLAVELDKPFTLLKIIREVPEISELKEPVLELMDSSETSDRIMNYIEKWNTNGRTAAEAQALLHLILRSIPPDELTGGKILRKSLMAYTEKHFTRLGKAQQQISLIQFLANET